MSLETFIRGAAAELGATRTGIAPAELESQDPDHLRDWLERGHHGTMGYMERDPEVRSEIAKWFPEAKSVIVCLL